MTWPFVPNGKYSRSKDIHAVYGGQRQGGISTPRNWPVVFIFTGHGAKPIGYGDKVNADGSLRYTGEGQVGDMVFKKGNTAIRDHALLGKDLLVFETFGKGKPVRFLGQFVCDGWSNEQQRDRKKNLRSAIVFDLVPIQAVEEGLPGDEGEAVGDDLFGTPATLADLQRRAHAAAKPSTVTGKSTRNVYRRSDDVRDYVLARAAGVCEACSEPAPFQTIQGTPYLEPHHIRRLSDGGPDHPRHVAGVCPNCHRRAHYGADAVAFNKALAAKIASIEPLTLA